MLGGRYELIDQLGSGGMSVVWRARDTVLERTVAVKVLAGRYAQDPESRERIRAEARAAAMLSHPNVAHVYDYGESDSSGVRTPYVVMELVRGGTLQQRMAAGPLPPTFAMRVAAEVGAALAAAHADGLVHRDIKPANVMVAPAGAKVVDFGIAAAISPGGSEESEFEIYGTPAYLAPERLTDQAVSPASDVYALGVLLYRLLSGHSPWTVETTTQMLSAHIYIEPTPLTPLPDVPDYIVALCNRCLSKDPTHRPSARDAAALLAQGAGMRVVDDLPTPEVSGPATDHEPSVLIRGEPVDGRADAPTVAIPAEAGSALVDVRASVVTAFAAGASAARSATGPTGFAAAGAGGRPGLAAEPAGFAGASGTPSGNGPPGFSGNGPPGSSGDGPPGFSGDRPPGFSGDGPAVPGPGGDPAAPATPARSRRYLWLAAVVVPVAAAAALLWMLRPEAPTREAAAAVPPAAHESIIEAPGSPSKGTGTPDVPGGAAGVTPPAATASNGNPAATPAQPDRPPAATPTAPAHPTSKTPTPTPGHPVPTSTDPRHEWTLTSVGGTIQATCPAPDTAKLLSWTATPPYRVKDVKAGPAPTANVVFKHGAHTVKMKITCSGGVPSTENIEN